MNFGLVHLSVARPAVSNDRNWPKPGFPYSGSKLTFATAVRKLRGSFLARSRTPTFERQLGNRQLSRISLKKVPRKRNGAGKRFVREA